MSGWTTLVAPETLAVALSRPDVAVVDCRFALTDPGAGEQAWLAAHIPGAVYAHLDRDLSDHRKSGEGRHPTPEAADFTAKLGRWGIAPHMQVVAYDDAGGALAAARFWFLMRLLGHEKVAVLDGGWARWTALGLPSDSHPVARAPALYAGEFDRSRVVGADQVAACLSESTTCLLDARAAERFRGESEMIDRVAGHVPGAINRPYTRNLGVDGRFRTPVELAAEFRALLDGREPKDTVVMCGSGVTACHHLLAMERAGLRGAKLFAGSWSGWISDHTRPVATGD